MSKLKKIFSLLLILCLIFNLTACRRKDETDDGKTKKPNTTKQKVVKEENLYLWVLFDPCSNFKEQIKSFEGEYPEYKIICKKYENAQEFEKELINEIAEGEGPDIFSIKNSKVKKHYKKIAPLSVDDDLTTDVFKETFFPIASSDLILTNEEEEELIYALPLYIDTLALYYNKKLFQDNEKITDQIEPVKTWEELKKQVRGLTKESAGTLEKFTVSGIAMGRADNIMRSMDIIKLLFLQYKVEMINQKNKIAFASKNGEKAIDLYTSFTKKQHKQYSWNKFITARSDTAQTKEVGVFAKGKVAMIFGYSWLYEELKRDISIRNKIGKGINLEDVGIAPVPQLKEDYEGGRNHALAEYYPLTVSRNSEHPEAAWAFLKHLVTSENLDIYYKKTHKASPRFDMVKKQETDKIFGVFAQQAAYSKSFYSIDDEAFDKIFKEVIEGIEDKQKTSSMLKKAKEKMECVLAKQKDSKTDCEW